MKIVKNEYLWVIALIQRAVDFILEHKQRDNSKKCCLKRMNLVIRKRRKFKLKILFPLK